MGNAYLSKYVRPLELGQAMLHKRGDVYGVLKGECCADRRHGMCTNTEI